MVFSVGLKVKNSNTYSTTNIIALKFTKERYTPYTLLTGKVWLSCVADEVQSISLSVDNVPIHFGIPDSLEHEFSNGRHIYSFSSRGYTSALTYNQPTPGLYSNATLASILSGEITLPNISFEYMTDSINYVYINDNDNMWDGAVAFARKFCGDYPYIFGPNTVRVTRFSNLPTVTIPKEKIVSECVGEDYSRMISDLKMRDVDGNYNSFTMTDTDAVNRDIIRHRHIAFDRQWLSNQDEALKSRIDYSMRGFRYKKICYEGFSKEDLRQYVNAEGQSFTISQKEISKLTLSLSQKGVFTTLWFYDDRYS